MIRLDMGEPSIVGTLQQEWARDCIQMLRAVEEAIRLWPNKQPVHATLTFNKVTVPVYADDDVSRVSLRLSAAKPKTSQTHPATMIGRSWRAGVE